MPTGNVRFDGHNPVVRGGRIGRNPLVNDCAEGWQASVATYLQIYQCYGLVGDGIAMALSIACVGEGGTRRGRTFGSACRELQFSSEIRADD